MVRLRSGYPEILLCTLAWASIGLIRKQVTIPSSSVALFRMLFGAIVVVAWLAVRRRLGELRPRARWPLLAASGAVLAVHWLLMFEAYRRLDVAPTILIVFLGPVLTAALSPVVLREPLRAVTVGALGLAVGGIALIAVPGIDTLDAVGLAAAIASAVLFGVLLVADKLVSDHYSAPALVAWQLTIGSVVLLPSLGATAATQVWRALPPLLLLGGVLTGLLGILFFRAVRALEAQRLGVIFYLEPAAATIYAWALLGETPTIATLAGGVLIVAAGLAIILTDEAASAAGLPEPIAAGDSRT